ncbi:probable carboxylesterase 15 [Tanacetum coccineum]
MTLKSPTKSTRAGTKLSVMYFLQGGGFCGGSFAWPNFHNCCLRISSALHAIVVAPDYRLAPEHRLPAAIDDSFGALKLLQELARNPKNDVVDCFDFDKFFIIGDFWWEYCTPFGCTVGTWLARISAY